MLTMFSEHSVVETNHDHQSDFSDILISLQTKREMWWIRRRQLARVSRPATTVSRLDVAPPINIAPRNCFTLQLRSKCTNVKAIAEKTDWNCAHSPAVCLQEINHLCPPDYVSLYFKLCYHNSDLGPTIFIPFMNEVQGQTAAVVKNCTLLVKKKWAKNIVK